MGGDFGFKKVPMKTRIKRIALGTAQFGMTYGIANQKGMLETNEVEELLNLARNAGIDTLDTAMLYGNCEEVLGHIGIADWCVVTKLPPIPDSCQDVSGWVEQSVTNSLNRMKISKMHGLLLHRPDQLLGSHGEELFSALQQVKTQGLTKSIGVSIYAPSELDTLMQRFSFDLVQAPFNILDRRMRTSGWLSCLRAQEVAIHVRSIFLQGLLLMTDEDRLLKFNRWQPLWTSWRSWLQDVQLNPLQACLGFSLDQNEIDRVIVGVDSIEHLKEILTAVRDPFNIDPPLQLACEDPDLINPSRWGTL